MSESMTCIKCSSDRIVDGTLGGKAGAGFYPHQTKAFRISLDSPAISINRKISYLCVDCGLVWTTTDDLRKALARIIHWGTDDLKSRLGMFQDAAIVPREKKEGDGAGEGEGSKPDRG